MYQPYMAKKPHKTEGARLLRRKIDRLIQISKGTLERQHIATRLGVDPNTLGHWVAERRRPTVDQAVRLQSMMKIKVATWTQAPSRT